MATAFYFVACVLGGWGVLTGVFLTLTSLSFWSEDRMSILPPVYNLFNFARYPLDIYRPFIRILLTWVIPFGFVAFYPSAGLLSKANIFEPSRLMTTCQTAAFGMPVLSVFQVAPAVQLWVS